MNVPRWTRGWPKPWGIIPIRPPPPLPSSPPRSSTSIRLGRSDSVMQTCSNPRTEGLFAADREYGRSGVDGSLELDGKYAGVPGPRRCSLGPELRSHVAIEVTSDRIPHLRKVEANVPSPNSLVGASSPSGTRPGGTSDSPPPSPERLTSMPGRSLFRYAHPCLWRISTFNRYFHILSSDSSPCPRLSILRSSATRRDFSCFIHCVHAIAVTQRLATDLVHAPQLIVFLGRRRNLPGTG